MYRVWGWRFTGEYTRPRGYTVGSPRHPQYIPIKLGDFDYIPREQELIDMAKKHDDVIGVHVMEILAPNKWKKVYPKGKGLLRVRELSQSHKQS